MKETTPSVPKYLSPLTFFTTLTIRLIKKIMQASFALLATPTGSLLEVVLDQV
jgi:hypothetical protein